MLQKVAFESGFWKKEVSGRIIPNLEYRAGETAETYCFLLHLLTVNTNTRQSLGQWQNI